MRKIKKITAVVLSLITVLFSFSALGYAADIQDDELTEEETGYDNEIKLFEDYLVFYNSLGYYATDFYFEVKPIDGEESVIAVSGSSVEFIENKFIVPCETGVLADDGEYNLVISEDGEVIFKKNFIVSDVLAAAPEFKDTTYGFLEYEKRDMTNEIIFPVGYDEKVYLSYDNTSNSEHRPDGEVIDIDNFTVEANKRGYGWLVLKTYTNDEVCSVWFTVMENQPNTFWDAFTLSFKKFFDRSGDSAISFLMLIKSVAGAVALPFAVLFQIITLPFEYI